ncbi:hypothetical protein D915_010876 [Fasciola hepatica]|uniref:Uncharacterized protein n=1 Tax=Fasciola hepatica TaxID=6192 RepID=A0A4E0QV88_FASHE|nr:hypothetical protein D915_010876 [Fasciola hepatica]
MGNSSKVLNPERRFGKRKHYSKPLPRLKWSLSNP